MSDESEENQDLRVEIQKLLAQINVDMASLKNELSALNSQIEASAPLPMTSKAVNEQLIVAAKEAGINLENLDEEEITEEEQSEEAQSQSGDDDPEQSNNDPATSLSNAVSAAAEQLSGMMKKVKK